MSHKKTKPEPLPETTTAAPDAKPPASAAPSVSALKTRLDEAVQGLLYPSESDEPVKTFTGPPAAVTPESVLLALKHPANTPVKEISVEDFFAPVTRLEDWYGDEERARAEKFTALQKLLQDNLHDIKVFKCGEIERDVYAVGLDAEGNLAGVQTKVVET